MSTDEKRSALDASLCIQSLDHLAAWSDMAQMLMMRYLYLDSFTPVVLDYLPGN